MAKRWWDKKELIRQVGEVGEGVVIQHFLGDDEQDPCLKIAKTWTAPDGSPVFLKNMPTITHEYCIENPDAPAVLMAFAAQVLEMRGVNVHDILFNVIGGLKLDREEAMDALSRVGERIEQGL